MAPRLVHPFCHSSWLLPTDRHTHRPFRICGSGPYLMLCIVTQPHKYCAAINIEIFETEFALVFVATKVWRYRWLVVMCARVCVTFVVDTWCRVCTNSPLRSLVLGWPSCFCRDLSSSTRQPARISCLICSLLHQVGDCIDQRCYYYASAFIVTPSSQLIATS